MNDYKTSPEIPELKSGMLVRIWGMLPTVAVVLMLVAITVLGVTCSEKKERLAAAPSRFPGSRPAAG